MDQLPSTCKKRKFEKHERCRVSLNSPTCSYSRKRIIDELYIVEEAMKQAKGQEGGQLNLDGQFSNG